MEDNLFYVMNWIQLTSPAQLDTIRNQSAEKPQVIFKHSTRCAISAMVKGRLEKKSAPQSIDFYFLDLIAHRQLSNQVAETFQVHHESPQILLIKNGECVYDESHTGISMDDVVAETMR
jgi:bacillithiol system protein YtxJ